MWLNAPLWRTGTSYPRFDRVWCRHQKWSNCLKRDLMGHTENLVKWILLIVLPVNTLKSVFSWIMQCHWTKEGQDIIDVCVFVTPGSGVILDFIESWSLSPPLILNLTFYVFLHIKGIQHQTGFTFGRLGHALGVMGLVGAGGGVKSVRLSVAQSPEPLDEMPSNLMCELLTWMGSATALLLDLGPGGGAKRSNIVKFQWQSQFQRFLNQTLYFFYHI